MTKNTSSEEATDYEMMKENDEEKGEVSSETMENHYNRMDDGENGPSRSKLDISYSFCSMDTCSTADTERDKKLERLNSSDRLETEINFLNDDPCDMTYSRRIALHLMKSHRWYNPYLKLDDNIDDTKSMENSLDDKSDYQPLESNSNCKSEKNEDRHENPSLEKAWAFFDHVTLPRYLYKPQKEKSRKNMHWKKSFLRRLKRMKRKLVMFDKEQFDMASPGENHYRTKLYSPIFTPLNQMGDFGLGVGLYFRLVRSDSYLIHYFKRDFRINQYIAI